MKNKLKNLVSISLIVCLIASFLLVSNLLLNLSVVSTVSAPPQFLDVTISPSGNVKLNVGQHQLFTASSNGTSPFSYSWTANGSLLGTEETLNFSFPEACTGLMLNLRVVDSLGRNGFASVWVADPYASPDLYLDSLPSTASYVIEGDGLGWYRMVNYTGKVEMTSTNQSAVFGYAIGNLTSGGHIHYKSGTFPFTVNYTLSQSNMLFTGEGKSTVWQLGGNTTNMITGLTSGNGVSNLTFDNIAFDGNYATYPNQGATIPAGGNALRFDKGSVYLIHNCFFYGWIHHPIVSQTEATSKNFIVSNCYFTNNSFFDVAFAGAGGNSSVTNCIFEKTWGVEFASDWNIGANNHFIAPTYRAFICTADASYNLIADNVIVDCTNYGISVEGNNNTICNNHIYNTKMSYAILLASNNNFVHGNYIENSLGGFGRAIGIVTCDNNIIRNNVIIKALVGFYIHDAASDNNIFADNTLLECTTLVTDNSGGDTIWGYGNILNGKPCEASVTTTNTTATTFVFNHGLTSTVTGVWCSFNFTGWTSWTWTSTSTQVTVTVTGTLPAVMKCYAKVEYRP